MQPLFDHTLIDFVGEVDEEQNRDLLVNAYALLFPIDWPEPFGMVQIEAMACGTPVLAMRRGAVPEIVEHGVTGLIGDSVEELVELAPYLGKLDRLRVRNTVAQRFSARAMAAGYAAVYRQLITAQAQFPEQELQWVS